MGHAPVMLEEVLTALAPGDGETLLDGTFGGGGYTRAILARADCRVLAVDRDPAAFARAEAAAANEPRLTPLLGRFGDLDALALNAGTDALDGVVLDLGVSSFQLDEADRGFSFMRDGPLDMRMGRDGPSAADAVAQLDERDLAALIRGFGEEPKARRIAGAIVRRRQSAPFLRTLDLADAVEAAVGGRRGSKTHPATRTFQAIRMYVNDELGELAKALEGAERMLRTGGRLVVVAFHSLEDRLVKLFFRARAGLLGGASRHAPERGGGRRPSFELIDRRAQSPSDAEVAANPRARSAKLRLGVRTAAAAWPPAPVEALFGLPPLAALEAGS